jgi:hypothetical protein
MLYSAIADLHAFDFTAVHVVSISRIMATGLNTWTITSNHYEVFFRLDTPLPILQCNLLESELLYDWRFTANQFVLARSPLRLTTSNFIFQIITCGYSLYVTSSLTRGWVCRLQLLLALASTFILGSESHGTHDHILLSQIRDSPNLEGQVPVFISPRKRVARLYTQALGSLFVASYDSQG